MVDAVIIAIGSELLTPSRTDTNSLHLTDQLNALGIEVRQKVVVGDDREALTEAVRHALQHASVVILTGGLGPTEDDVTRDAVAAALDRPLEFRQDISDAIEERFRARGRKMAEINKRQAFIIQGAEVLANPAGTAPGLWIELPSTADTVPSVPSTERRPSGSRQTQPSASDKLIVLLPGPPSEMKPVFEQECLPRFRRRVPGVVIRSRFYRVTGLTESDLDTLIAPVYTKYTNPATTVLASAGDIQVHLRARCESEDEAERLLAEIGDPIEALLGARLYSTNGDSLEAAVGMLLRARNAKLAIAESLTGGQLGQRITSVSGSSDYFVGGFLTYSDAMKSALLGVDPALLAQHTAVSQEVAAAMAAGARDRTGADYAIATTGEAGPKSNTGATPGTVFIGYASKGHSEAVRFVMPGDRNRVRGFATNAALDLLRRRLLGLKS